VTIAHHASPDFPNFANMTEVASLSSMNFSQIHSTLVAFDIDFWSKASEREVVATYERCISCKSPTFRIVRSAWFLFAFAFLVLYLWWLGHQGRTKGAAMALILPIAGCVFAGLLRLLMDWLSDVAGLDRAASVARQLKPLSMNSPAYARINNLVETRPECAAYQRQLTICGRTLRLVDLGAMVYLSNKTLAAKRA
jgi:hypothetical protein